MAAPLDGSNKEQRPKEQLKSDDVELAFRMGVKLMSEGKGLETIEAALNESQDPAQVIGQFLAQIMGVLAERLQQEMQIDPRVFLAKGGWLELMLNYIEKKLGYPEEFSDQIFMQTVEVIKAAAQNPQQAQQGQPAPQPQQGAPAPGGLGG